MNPYEFQKVREATDLEWATHAIFYEAYNKWSDVGSEALTSGQRVVLAVETYFGEVLNGGFYQYFSNGSGAFSNFAPTALRQVGLCEYALVLESFLALFPEGKVSEHASVRQKQLDSIDDSHNEDLFEQLEGPFWDLYHKNKKEFRTKLFNFILANEADFISA